VIDSVSMMPTIEPGDRVLVTKVFVGPSRGDVIVFGDPHDGRDEDRGIWGGFTHWLSETFGFARPEDDDFIKRVIGLPGEGIEIHDHVVFVDGRPLQEPYLTDAAREAMADFGPVEVPADALFVMGDNRGNSSDSRSALGFVPLDVVIGRAVVFVWPPSRLGWVH
jgi:signal peptidase I